MPSFRRFWLTTLLPLAVALPLLVNVTWHQRVSGLPLGEGVQRANGFPWPALTDSLISSTTPHIFVLPLLLNWTFALLWLTAAGRWLWPRLKSDKLKLLSGLTWFLLLPTLLINGVTFGLARWSWVSPFPVLETVGARQHFGFW